MNKFFLFFEYTLNFLLNCSLQTGFAYIYANFKGMPFWLSLAKDNSWIHFLLESKSYFLAL